MNIEPFLRATQKQLFNALCKKYTNYSIDGEFILVEGDAPVMLIAHLDTVHEEPVKIICKSSTGNTLMSPQGIGGDDRCGVYAITKLYQQAKIKPWLLYTCNEEIGGIGAKTFTDVYNNGDLPASLADLKMLIEIDRRGSNDAVYYDCLNTEFEAYITSKGFKTAYGSFSDISIIAPELDIAAVNLSSGYYNAHTQHEYIYLHQLENVISRVATIITDATAADFPKYKYWTDFDYFGEYGTYGEYDEYDASIIDEEWQPRGWDTIREWHSYRRRRKYDLDDFDEY